MPPPSRAPLLALALICAGGSAAAQEFGLYLKCSGTAEVKGRSAPAHLDLALRRNNQTALIQRSDVLPVGDRLKFEISPTLYSMVLRSPSRGSAVWYDWIRGTVVVWAPDLQNLHTTRLSIDRQTAALEGDMRDGTGALLGMLRMKCEHHDNDDVPEPKF